MHRPLGALAMLAFSAVPAASAAPSVDATMARTSQSAPIPDFSGVWHRWFRPGLGPSAAGPGPLVNRSLFGGVSDYNQLVGDYTNPILKPQAAATVKQLGDLSLKGIGYPTPSNQCWPSGVPYIFWNFGLQLVQQPNKITLLYLHDHEIRQV